MVAARVAAARDRQHARGVTCNAELSHTGLMQKTVASSEAAAALRLAAEKLHLSARAATRTLRVARTIADLECAEVLSPVHLAEALAYRATSRT